MMASRKMQSVMVAVIVFEMAVHSVLAAWTMTWSDDFDGPNGGAPDGGKWQFEIGNQNNGWGNSEHQYYTADRGNSALDGSGNLVITAKKADQKLDCFYGPCEYTSARLKTFKKFDQMYGKFEARIKTPTGKGIWPAFWLLGSKIETVGWPECGEIDIMEIRGSAPNTVSGAVHGPGYSGGDGIAGTLQNDNSLADDFHIYSVEWTDRRISVKLDGREYHVVTKDEGRMQGKKWVFDSPFFILLNLAVGGNFDGEPNSDTQFPQTMTVDYVRVYKQT